MKVICVDNYCMNPNMTPPVEGDIYTNIGTSPIHKDSIYLAELPTDRFGRKCSYVSKQFLPIGGPDERERLEAYLQEQEKMDKVLMALAETSDEPMPQDAFDRVWKNIQSTL